MKVKYFGPDISLKEATVVCVRSMQIMINLSGADILWLPRIKNKCSSVEFQPHEIFPPPLLLSFLRFIDDLMHFMLG